MAALLLLLIQLALSAVAMLLNVSAASLDLPMQCKAIPGNKNPADNPLVPPYPQFHVPENHILPKTGTHKTTTLILST